MINQGSALDRALNHDDMNAIRELLEDIARYGLQEHYIKALFAVVIPESELWDIVGNDEIGGYIDRVSIFALIAATPEQYARAFIASTPAP